MGCGDCGDTDRTFTLRRLKMKSFLGVLLLVLLASLFLSQGEVYAEDEDLRAQVQRMQAMLEAQQAEISQLKAQVVDLSRENGPSSPERPAPTVSMANTPPQDKGLPPGPPGTTLEAREGETPFWKSFKDVLGDIRRKREKPEPVVKVGTGTLNIGGLFQAWYEHDSSIPDEFRIRRTEIKLYGDVVPSVKYTIMFDPAKIQTRFPKAGSDGRAIADRDILQDAYFTLDFLPHHQIDMGQFKIPVVEEGLRSSVKLDFVERSLIARTFSDRRDIGVQLRGQWKYLYYQLAALNGEELNAKDENNDKDLVFRLIGTPLKGLELGGSYYAGVKDMGAKAGDAEKRRQGLEFRFDRWNWATKFEYLWANDANVNKRGWYAQTGYTLWKELQPIVRYEVFDPDANGSRRAGNKERDLTFGLNWFLAGHNTKFQINYTIRDEGRNEKSNNQVLTAFQVAW